MMNYSPVKFTQVARHNPSPVGEGVFIDILTGHMGQLAMEHLIEWLARMGKTFGANFGTAVTPITFVAGAVNRPDGWIRVPSATAIIPLTVGAMLATDAGTSNTIEVRIAQNDIGNGTSSAAAAGPLALRTDVIGGGSNCVARQLATGDTTAETNPLSLARDGFPAASGTGSAARTFKRDELGYPILIGAGSLELFVFGTTTQPTGYGWATWAEVPTAWLNLS